MQPLDILISASIIIQYYNKVNHLCLKILETLQT